MTNQPGFREIRVTLPTALLAQVDKLRATQPRGDQERDGVRRSEIVEAALHAYLPPQG